ncbi:MAG: pyruvate kinase alpha/beta domain-containing protein [Chloroflexota bacterium]
MEARIVYFEKPGKENTDAVLEIVRKRASELGIRTAVIASYHGFTADRAVRLLDGMKIVIIAGFYSPTTENLAETFSQGDERLIKSKATVLVATHLFAGMSAAMRKKFSNVISSEIVASTLRMISTGVKVAVECSVMAADAGLAPTDEDVIAVGGTRSGADTAIVVRPVNSQNIFDLKVKEILCKPREW